MSNFVISEIVILQSLEDQELKTGDILYSFIEREINLSGLLLPIKLYNVGNFLEFEQRIRFLVQQASVSRSVPFLHIECHGDLDDGLLFRNGSSTPWGDVALLIAELNAATGCNLVVAFSCCYGAHFLGEIKDHVERAPALCVIGPVEAVYPDELLNSMRNFYRNLVSDRDFASSALILSSQRLTSGGWHLQTAESWYEKTIIGLIKNMCTLKQTEIRVRRLHREGKQRGVHKSLGSIKRYLKAKNHEFYASHFDRYFMIDRFPSNRDRFERSRIRLKEKIHALKTSGMYLL
jgi:hypothetical protein